MSEDPNNDAAALAASKSPDASEGRDPGVKNKKLIIFLILVMAFLVPLAGIMILIYTNNTQYIPFYPQ